MLDKAIIAYSIHENKPPPPVSPKQVRDFL
jgi:hypothetical protein